MKAILNKLYQPNVLLGIIIMETIVFTVISLSYRTHVRNFSQVLAQESRFTANWDEDIRACLRLPVSERPACAKMIGAKLIEAGMGTDESVILCMKLRPLYNRYCMEAIRNNPN